MKKPESGWRVKARNCVSSTLFLILWLVLVTNPDVILLAAGLNTRFKSSTPKALTSLGEETVLGRQLRLVREVFEASQVIVVGGHEQEKLRRRLPGDAQFVLNERFEETNVAHSAVCGLDASLTSSVVMILGDLVFNRAALSGLNRLESAVLVDAQPNSRPQEVGLTVVDDEVTQFAYGLPLKFGGIFSLVGTEKKAFVDVASRTGGDRRFLFEVLNTVLNEGGRFQAYAPSGLKLAEIDHPRDVEPARKMAQANLD